jgi:hypothetical protein
MKHKTNKQERNTGTGGLKRECARIMAIMTTPRYMSRFHPSSYFESLNVAIHQRYSAWNGAQGSLVGVLGYDSSRHNMPFLLGYGLLRFLILEIVCGAMAAAVVLLDLKAGIAQDMFIQA